MADIFSNLGLGFGVVFQLVQWTPAFLGGTSIPIPVNILLCLIGALVGTLVGVLPGIGTIATVAMLLPITFGLPPVGALDVSPIAAWLALWILKAFLLTVVPL